jgi:hypothetical protein
MLLTRLLNACHHFPGFVYARAQLIEARKTVEIEVRPRTGSKGHCATAAASPAWLRPVARTALRLYPDLGFRRGTALPHAPGAVSRLRRQGRGGALGCRQAHS